MPEESCSSFRALPHLARHTRNARCGSVRPLGGARHAQGLQSPCLEPVHGTRSGQLGPFHAGYSRSKAANHYEAVAPFQSRRKLEGRRYQFNDLCSSSCSSAQWSRSSLSFVIIRLMARALPLCLWKACAQFGALSSPASQPSEAEFIGSLAMTSFSTYLHLGHSNRRCSKPTGPGSMRVSIMRNVQCKQRGRSIDVRNGPPGK
jgi:hypothetical protein